MKKCSFCAEEIQDEAIVCKHCGRDLKGKQEGRWHSATIAGLAALCGAIIGALATLGASYMQGHDALELERQKFESALILRATETNSQEEASRNLLFLVSAGFVRDPSGRIQALAEQGKTIRTPRSSGWFPPGYFPDGYFPDGWFGPAPKGSGAEEPRN